MISGLADVRCPATARVSPPRARRWASAATVIALVLALSACGGGGGSSTPGPDAAAAPAPRPSFALDPAIYSDPFAGARAATAEMPELAVVLATGLAEASGRSGDAGSPAAKLSADLTYLLTTHVYAFGAAAAAVNETTPTSAETEAAMAVVRMNGDAVATVLEKLAKEIDPEGEAAGGGRGNSRPFADPDPKDPGPDDQEAKDDDEDGKDGKGKNDKKNEPKIPPFDLEAYDLRAEWEGHIDTLFDYVLAATGDNDRGRSNARADLEDFQAEAGRYFRAVTENRLSAGDVTAGLEDYLEAVIAAFDAMAAQDADGYLALREAAGEIPDLAARLAAGYAEATDREGSVYDEAAQLRTEMTNLLTGHSYLSSLSYLSAFTSLAAGPFTAAAYRRVQVSLDQNSEAIAELVGEVADPRSEFEFLTGWRVQLRDLQRYAEGLIVGDLAARTEAMSALEAYLGEVGKFFKKVTDGAVARPAVTHRLQAEIESQAGVIDSLHAVFGTPEP